MRKMKSWNSKKNPVDHRVDMLVQVFNHERSLESCLDSILSQDHENLFLTVIDDSSTDGSWEIVKEYESRFPNRITAKRTAENRGRGMLARQECRFFPTGDFWGIVEGDDWWVRGSKVSEQIRLIASSPGHIGASGTTIQVDSNGSEMDRIRPSKKSWNYLDWVLGAG